VRPLASRLKPVIVIAYKPGRLGNRLLQFATFIGFAERTGVRIVNPSFDEYAHMFEGTSRDPFCRYPPQRSIVPRGQLARRALFVGAYYAARAIVRLGLHSRVARVISLEWPQRRFLDQSFLDEIRGSWLVFIQGWRLVLPGPGPSDLWGPPGWIAPHTDVIRRHLRLKEEYVRRVDALLEKARQGCDRLIGVHIRQGDFLTDKNQGRYYYTTAQYVEKLRALSDLYRPERVGFFVCSDEPQPAELFADLACTFGGEDPVVDLHSLARCDAIIGPPSSFSLWAALIGGSRFHWIFDMREQVTDGSFAPFSPIDQDEYAERFYGYQDAKRGRAAPSS